MNEYGWREEELVKGVGWIMIAMVIDTGTDCVASDLESTS